jgi:hypothetical protein
MANNFTPRVKAILIEDCRRFAAGQPLLNVVDR